MTHDALMPPTTLLGIATAARLLGGTPRPALDAFRVSSVGRNWLYARELSAIAADCGLAARPAGFAAPREHEILLVSDEISTCLLRRDHDGLVRIERLAPDGSQVRAEPIAVATWPPDAATLLLSNSAASRENAAGAGKFGLALFWHRIARHRREVNLVLIAACVIHIITLALPLVFAALVDRVLPNEETATLQALAALAMLAIGMEYALRRQRDRKIAWVAARVDAQTVHETFRHLLSLPLMYFHGVKAGVVARNLRLAEDIREFVTGPAVEAAIKLAALPFALAVLLLVSPPLTAIVLAAGAALGLCLYCAWAPYRAELEKLTTLEGVRQALAVETINGAGTVKALALEQPLLARWQPLAAEIAASNERIANIHTATAARLDAIERLADLAIIAIGILLVMHGGLTVGALIAFKMIAAQVVEPIVHAANLAQQWQTTRRQVELLGDIMNAAPEVSARSQAVLEAPRFTGGFRFTDVSFTYPGAHQPAVAGLNIDCPMPAEQGITIAIVGESGSGKSTVTKLLLALLPPAEGRLEFSVATEGPEGHPEEAWVDARDLHPEAIRRTLAVIGQDNQFFSGTIRDNLLMAAIGSPPSEAAIRTALEISCAAQFVDAQPNGLDTLLEEHASNLSGGERQRLSIARALLRDPPILVLDEATSALDVETEQAFRNNMQSFAAGRTLVVVAHRLNTVRHANIILVMNDGRVVECGTHEDLLQIVGDGQAGVYAKMWKAQVNESAAGDAANIADGGGEDVS